MFGMLLCYPPCCNKAAIQNGAPRTWQSISDDITWLSVNLSIKAPERFFFKRLFYYYYYYLFGIKTHTKYKHKQYKTKARDICLELEKVYLKTVARRPSIPISLAIYWKSIIIYKKTIKTLRTLRKKQKDN